jgi:hypothetical protein
MRSRRILVLAVMVAALTLSVAGVALAAVITGNDRPNTLQETPEDDQIRGRRGADLILADIYGDDADEAFGNRGNDVVRVNDDDPDDLASGGPGTDRCRVDVEAEAAASCERVIVA